MVVDCGGAVDRVAGRQISSSLRPEGVWISGNRQTAKGPIGSLQAVIGCPAALVVVVFIGDDKWDFRVGRLACCSR